MTACELKPKDSIAKMEAMAQPTRQRLAAAADGLTALRLLGAVFAIPLISSNLWAMTALLVSIMWIADLLDGRLARLSGLQTRLGHLDMVFDTVFAAGVVVGLAIVGTLPLWLALGSLIVFGGLFAAGNMAAAMLLQLTGFIPLLVELWLRKPDTWWAPFVVMALAGIVDWKRLVFTNIPLFIRGVAGRFEHR